MVFIAHRDGERVQTMKEHSEGTALLAEEFASQFGKGEWGYCCGMLHDIGKYSKAFQKKLSDSSNAMVDHSTAGAKVCFERRGMYPCMSCCIAGHHSGLPDWGSSSDTGSASTLQGRMKKQIEDFGAYQEEIKIPEVKTPPFDPKKVADRDFSLSVFIRMLYSCLVDADFLDTETFMKNGQSQREAGDEPQVLFERLKDKIAGWLDCKDKDTVNGRRTEILRNCLACGAAGRGAFQLTVPTGGGKTIASLAFALRHAVENQMNRVIYVIPYTSIIEQNAQVFRQILGDENVLENHCNVDYESLEELKPMQLAAENWDKPVVVTTNVQFFESLFSNKSSKCRKLHNIANSVIIFDEVQMLPTDYLKPCIAMMEEMVCSYRSSIVLCTATQPALTPFFRSISKVTELCPRVQEQFRFFERVTFQNIGTISREDLVTRLEQEKQALCIVNTKKRAQALYESMKGEGVFHLSTAMYPKHRRRILEKIRTRLAAGEKCILISTSLVEAGVDLDFQSVYRQLAGVDSMIQAAGRCNREGKRNLEESKVFIFQLDEKEYVPGQRLQIDASKMLLTRGEDIFSLEGINHYFQALYHFRGEGLDKKNILGEFQRQCYQFAWAAEKFKLIEENTITVFIGKEEEAKELLWQMENQGYTKSGMRRAGQYCVQLYENEFEKLRGAGMVRMVSEDMKDFFVLSDETQYTEERGLNLGTEAGIEVFL